MTFGEVIHYVSCSNSWPEPVRGIASLLLPSPDSDIKESNPPESLDAPSTPAQRSYNVADFKFLIHSTAAELSALAELPRYGGARSTVPLWSQLLHALANTLSEGVLILEDTPFIMPRAQDITSQPPDLIDGNTTLVAAHIVYSTSSVCLEQSNASPKCEEEGARSVYSTYPSPRDNSKRFTTGVGSGEGEDASIYSANIGSSHGSILSLEGLNLPLHAHMFPGRWKWHYAVLPVFMVADAHNIIPLLCSALYQRRVWGIYEPVVGLCCSSTGTTATAIFGWIDSDQSEDGCMPAAHLALTAGAHPDSSIGVFDFTDSLSAISLAQFVLRLRSHFQDIKRSASMEAIDPLIPLHWRSDLPDFDIWMEGDLENRVVSWTHQVHVQTSSSETTSTSSPRTPSPLPDPVVILSSEEMSSQGLDTIEEDVNGGKSITRSMARMGLGSTSQSRSLNDRSGSQALSDQSHQPVLLKEKAPSRLSNSTFAAISDAGLVEETNMSNWLLERNTFTVGRIPIPSDDLLAGESAINEMINVYDQMTGFSWSAAVQRILSVSTIDTSVLDIRDQLFQKHLNESRSSLVEMPEEDVKFISARFSALLHAIKGARGCQDIASLRGANEAERRHEWDALLLKFFQPVLGQRDVLLERTLNSARNLAVHDISFAKQALSHVMYYARFCLAQWTSMTLDDDADLIAQASTAQERAGRFNTAIASRIRGGKFLEETVEHSRREPAKGTSDAALVIPCPGAATQMLECIQGDKAVQDGFLKSFILVHGSPDKKDPSPPNIQRRDPNNPQPDSTNQPHPPTPSHVSAHHKEKQGNAILQNVYFVHPDRIDSASRLPRENALPEASDQHLLLPVLLSEYKKKDASTVAQAMNQMRTYLVSALSFLDALGITEHPVFGLIVNGRLGAITMGWKKDDKIYIMDRNVRHYDITDPLDAFQFVSILLRLARHGLELRARFDERKDGFYESLRMSTYTPWSKLAQIDGKIPKDGTEAA